MGRNIINWERMLKEKWSTLCFRDVKVETHTTRHIFEAEVSLNDLDPEAVRVELYADGINGSNPIRQEMTRIQSAAGQPRGGIYRATVSESRLATDYMARIIPRCAGVAVPLEVDANHWQR